GARCSTRDGTTSRPAGGSRSSPASRSCCSCSVSTSWATGCVTCWILGWSGDSDALGGLSRGCGPGEPERQAHGERRAGAVAAAFRGDPAAVELDEVADEGQPEADAAVHTGHRAVRLPEPVEDVRQERGGDAHARVADYEPRLVADAIDTHAHTAARRRELDRVGQQIADD